MSSFIEQLETRQLFSVTGTTIVSHQAAIQTAATAAKSELSALFSTSTVDTSVVFTLLSETGKKSNAPLAKKLDSDLNKAGDFLSKDLDALLNPALADTFKAANDASQLLASFSTKLDSAVIADEKTLVKSVGAPVSAYNVLLDGNLVTNDLNALLSANPGDAKLESAIDKRLSDVATQKTKLSAAIGTFASQVLSFESDLKALTGG